jgi:hypothetical protein
MYANLVGVPHPAPRIEASGIDFSSFEPYPTSSATCAVDREGCKTVVLFPEQHPPPISAST